VFLQQLSGKLYQIVLSRIVSRSYTLYLNKDAPNLASCSFDKHGLTLIIYGKRHQHNFKNYAPIQLSLSLHIYLLYLVLNCSNENDAMLTSLTVCK